MIVKNKRGESCRPHIEYSVGNLKVGKDTIILNITSARDCMALARNNPALGGRNLCQVPEGTCYAARSEGFRPQVLPYRRRQTNVWDSLTPEQIADDVRQVAQGRRRIPIKYLRMQESGDFRNAEDVRKMSRVADLLRGAVHVYTYTARRDLFPAPHSTNLTINGSGFMVDNDFHVVGEWGKGPRCRGIKGGGCGAGMARLPDGSTKQVPPCPNCKVTAHKVIQELLQGSGKGRKALLATGNNLVGDEHGGVAQGTDDIPTEVLESPSCVLEPVTEKRKKSLSGPKTNRPDMKLVGFRGLR